MAVQPLKVMTVIEDVEFGSKLLDSLRSFGCNCSAAADACEALEKVRDHDFDLVISDLSIHGKAGLDLMHEAKRHSSDLSFILINNSGSNVSASDLIAKGAYDSLPSPLDLGDLHARLRGLQREKSLSNRLKEAMLAQAWEAEVNTTVARMSGKLMELESIDDMAQVVLESAKRLTGSRLGYIGYVDVKTGTIVSPAVARKDIDTGDDEDLRQAFEDLAGWAVRHGQSLLANGFEDPELLGISSDGYFPLDHMISVPAIVNGNVLGQIVLANSSRDYTERDTSLLQSLAAMYALATQHLQASLSLRQTNDYLENIFENSPDALGIVDKSGRFLKWNRMAAELYGYTLEELKDKTAFDLYAESSEREKIMALLRSEGSVKRHETLMKRKDGTEQAFEISIGLLTDRLEGTLGSVCIARDLSPLKKVIGELRRTHREMSQLLASIPSFLIELDREGRITRWNSAAEKLFAMGSADVLGRHLDYCRVHWDSKRVLDGISLCQTKEIDTRLESLRFTQQDGKEGFLNITISPIKDSNSEPSGILLLGNDITRHKILESQLVQAQKLESIGQLAAGIAHEINTPAQYVGDNSRFLQEAFNDLEQVQANYDRLLEAVRSGKPIEDHVRAIETASEKADLEYIREEIPKAVLQSLDGIDRISRIVRAMKEFSHPGTDAKTNIDLNRAIESTITVARNEWKYVAEMVTDFDPQMPFVPCLPGEFNQVILNMIMNATHAISEKLGKGGQEKGTITISTSYQGEFAEIRISDTGTGIREEIRSKIFDPFFTTKDVGKGTGQGLAISHSVIVEKHGGVINLESEVGKGSTFIIRIPVRDASGPGTIE